MRTIFVGVSLMTFAFSCFADGASAALLARLKEKYPSTNFSAVSNSPISGIYEVTMGKNIAYSDASGRYLIIGSMFDMQERADLTAPKREAISRVEWSKLPLSQSITISKGDGSRTFALFTDPECPYCRKIELTLAEMDNYTVHVFPYPIASLHPKATEKAIAVWCAADRRAAWQALMVKGQESPPINCQNPVAANVQLAASLGITGTPTLIRPDGSLRPGALPREALESWLSGK